MPTIGLKFGNETLPFEYNDEQFEVLGGGRDQKYLSDSEIGEKLDNPIGSSTIEDIVRPGETILLVVPDATRQTACASVINLVVRRLIANGTQSSDISAIFATGIHRPVSDEEKKELLTPFIAQRVKTIDHAPRDLVRIARMGETSGGIPIELNRSLIEHDHIILIGGVTFHYFAGFTGGRKLVCPGLASTRTVAATHKLAFDCETRSRRVGVGPGLLDGNSVHEAFMEAAGLIKPSFAINTIVDDAGLAANIHCGDWIGSHRSACDAYAANHTIRIAEKRELVIVSCGGYPHDINMIQAHKALDAAAAVCVDGGTILLLAECRDGLGRPDFLSWFDAENSEMLAEKLCEKYQVNGQTAWSLLKKAEKFDIRVVTSLVRTDVERMRLKHIDSISDCANGKRGYIVPFGAKYLFSHT